MPFFRQLAIVPHGLCALLLLALPLLAISCHEDHDDYYTTVHVNIQMPEGYTAEQMQGTVKLTNLNNKQAYSTSVFDGTTATLEVLRGVYAADVEGSLRYTDAEGAAHAGNFRAATPHCEVLQHPASVTLDIIFM